MNTPVPTGFFLKRTEGNWFRLLCWIVVLTFGINTLIQDNARAWVLGEPQNVLMPAPGTLIADSPVSSLPTLKAIALDPNDPFKMNFVVDSAGQDLNEQDGQEQVNLLIKYFLSFLSLPEEDLWVNLSPYEKNRIIEPSFVTTNAGRDMLEEDYILKQLASSLTYPDKQTGKAFWKKVFSRVRAEYGSLDIPVSSFNKVWVVPDRAVVYEENGAAFIAESQLKVLTEQDYLSIQKNSSNRIISPAKEKKIDQISSDITREIIVPELQREVNEGQYFAPLRQMYNSLILAIWFKKRFREHLIGQVYVNQRKTFGISLNDTQIKERVYAQYLKAFKKGVYNYVKEESDPITQEVIPRKYFSGGFDFAQAANRVSYFPASQLGDLAMSSEVLGRNLNRVEVEFNPLGVEKKELEEALLGAGRATTNTDFAQISLKPIKKLMIALAIVWGVGSVFAPSLQAAQYKVVGNTMTVLAEPGDDLGSFLLHSGYKNLWGPNGTVNTVGAKIEGVKDVNLISAGQTYVIPLKGNSSVQTLQQTSSQAATNNNVVSQVVAPQQGSSAYQANKINVNQDSITHVNVDSNSTASNVVSQVAVQPQGSPIYQAKTNIQDSIVAKADSNSTVSAGSGGGTPPPEKNLGLKWTLTNHASGPSRFASSILLPSLLSVSASPLINTFFSPDRPIYYFPPQDNLLNLDTLGEQILHNNLIAYAERAHWLEQHVQEKLPTAFNVGVSATGVSDNNGNNAVVNGGLTGGMGETVKIGSSGGYATGTQGNTINQISVKFTDFITGKIPKEKKLLIEKTRIAGYQYEAAFYAQRDTAENLFVEIAALDQNIKFQQVILDSLTNLKDDVERNFHQGVITPEKKNDFEKKLGEVDDQIRDWKRDRETKILRLNNLRGHSYESFSPDLRWDGDYSYPSVEQQIQWKTSLTEGNLNYLMNEARSAGNVIDLTRKLQNINNSFPSGNFNLLYGVGNKSINPNYPWLSTESGLTSPTTLPSGPTAVLTLKVPIFSQTNRIQKQELSIEKNKTIDDINYIKHTVSEQFDEILSNIKSYSQDIQDYEREYQKALKALEDKQNTPDVLKYDIADELNTIGQKRQKVIDSRMKFLKEKSKLRLLGLDIPLETWVPGKFGNVVASVDSPSVSSFDSMKYVVPMTPDTTSLVAKQDTVSTHSQISIKDTVSRVLTGTNTVAPITIVKDTLSGKQALVVNGSKGTVLVKDTTTKTSRVIVNANSSKVNKVQGINANATGANSNVTTAQGTGTVKHNQQPIVKQQQPIAKQQPVAKKDTVQQFVKKPVGNNITSGTAQANTGTVKTTVNNVTTPVRIVNNPVTVNAQDTVGAYRGSTIVTPYPVEDTIVAGSDGNIQGFSGATVYNKQHLILRIQDTELDGEINGYEAELVSARKTVADYIAGSATGQEVLDAQQQVNDLEQKLAGALQKREPNNVYATQDLKIISKLPANDDPVFAGKELVTVQFTKMARFQMNVPLATNLENIVLRLDGNHIENIREIERTFNGQRDSLMLTFEVNLAKPIEMGKPVTINYAFYPTSNLYPELSSIGGKGPLTVKVGHADPYSIPSPGTGVARISVEEGQWVNIGDKLFTIEHKALDQQNKAILSEIASIEKQLNPPNLPANTTVVQALGLKKYTVLTRSKVALEARQKGLQGKIDRMTVYATHPGFVKQIAAYKSEVLKRGNPVVVLSSGKDILGSTKGITKNSILIPNNWNVEVGYPVIIKTAQGVLLPGKVIASYGETGDLKDVHPVQISVVDPGDLLHENDAVQIIFPANEGKQIVLTAYNEQHSNLKANKGLKPGDIIYTGAMSGANTFALTGVGDSTGLDNMANILADPNPVTRQEALKDFLSNFSSKPGFIQVLRYSVLNSPADVGQEIFRFMAEKKSPDMRFIVETIDTAEKNNKGSVVQQGNHALRTIFTENPQALQNFSRNDKADSVFLNFLFQELDNSIAKMNFLQSHYWTSDQKAGICIQLAKRAGINVSEISKKGLANSNNSTVHLAGLIYASILREQARENIPEVFSLGGFADPARILGQHRPLEDDIFDIVQIKENAAQTDSFLIKAPLTLPIEDYINSDLFSKALEATNDLFKNSDLSIKIPSFDSIPQSQPQEEGVAYFNTIGQNDPSNALSLQKDYINKTAAVKNFVALANIFKSPTSTPLRSDILDLMMKDPLGIISVLNVYANSHDQELMSAVEARGELRDALKENIPEIKDASSNLIFRAALMKLYNSNRQNNEWALNLRLKTYSALEIDSADDPRGQKAIDEQIKVMATERALKMFEEESQRGVRWWAGNAVQGEIEKEKLEQVKQKIAQEDDPYAVNQFVERLAEKKGDGTIKKLIDRRDRIAEKIRHNDQTVPSFSSYWYLNTWFLSLLAALGIAGTLSGIRKYSKTKEDKKTTNDLIKDLHQDLEVPLETIDPKVYEPTLAPLKIWQEKLLQWKNHGLPDSVGILNDFNLILINAQEIIKLIPFSSSHIMREEVHESLLNEDYRVTLSHFCVLAFETLNVLNERLDNESLSDTQRVELRQDIAFLDESQEYASRYLRILNNRGSLDKVMDKKFPDGDWKEKVYPTIRGLMSYNVLLKKSREWIEEDIPVLLKEGNELMPGLYESPDSITVKSQGLLKTVISKATALTDFGSLKTRQTHKNRAFYGRAFTVLAASVTILLSLKAATFFGILSIFLGFGVYYWFHTKAIEEIRNRKMEIVDKRLREALSKKIGDQTLLEGDFPDRKAIMKLRIEEAKEAIKKELGAPTPNVQMIVIISNNPQNNEKLNTYMAGAKGTLIRRDIPVEIVYAGDRGSANAYFDALDTIKAKYSNVEKKQIMFVYDGKEVNSNTDLLDWAIAKGYRAARAGSGGHLQIYARDPSFSLVPKVPESGFAVSISRVDKEGLKIRGWANGYPNVRTIYEKPDLDKSIPEDMKDAKKYNLDNNSLKQFESLNGTNLFASNVVEIMWKLQGNKWFHDNRKEAILNMTSDILIPFLRQNRPPSEDLEKNILNYVNARSTLPDMKGLNGHTDQVKKILESTYKLYQQFSNGEETEMTALVPALEVLHPIFGNGHAKESREKFTVAYEEAGGGNGFIRVSDNAQLVAKDNRQGVISRLVDHAQVAAKVNGGIDLSSTRGNIQFKGSNDSLSAGANTSYFSSRLQTLGSFKGFEFQVIQYQPISNPGELFLGSSTNKSGPWFSQINTPMPEPMALQEK